MWPDWARTAGRGGRNYFRGYPVCVSIEVTHGCTAACAHCNLGGPLPGERPASPEAYAELLRAMQSPPYIQISGGEPLSRPDVFDVVRAVRGSDRTRQIIFVTNGSLLDLATYDRLLEAGVSRMSVSLDFPDERHDAFRKIPGLFQHLSQILPEIARRNGGGCAVALNTAITSANFREIVPIARVAHQWGVGVSYSAYTTMKTGDPSLMLSAAEVLELSAHIEELLRLRANGLMVLNPPSLLRRTVKFFARGSIPGCGAGRRFLVIRPDGALIPCSSFQQATYPSVEAMRSFVTQNTCGACFVAIRAYTDRKPHQFLADTKHLLRAALAAPSH
jgi:MoaA/NifB/PqqE/SkfB family radical SAM enzyme